MKIIIDIPSKHPLSGGVQRMLEMQSVLKEHCECELHLPNDAFPELFDYIITYSDNPRIDKLCQQAAYRQAKVIVYQLSYGMVLDRERKVIDHPDTLICCSTYHIAHKITSDPHVWDYENTFRNQRKFDVALMIHRATDKKFKEAFDFCKSQDMKIVLFGARNTGFNLDGAKEVFFNADVDQVRWVFSNTKKYMSLSTTEGLNRPGIEAMLCGCKPYIVDGCEIYQDGKNCKFITEPKEIYDNFKIMEYNDIKRSLKKHTWENVLKKLGKIIGVKFEKRN